MKYEISIRITFSEEITKVLRKEKERFINNYGSSYRSEPHITLYLDSYTAEGYPKLLRALKELSIEPFTISLLEPKVRMENERRRNLYLIDVSNKEALAILHKKISDIAESKTNLGSIEGKKVVVSRITVFFYGKEDGAAKAHLIEEVAIPFERG